MLLLRLPRMRQVVDRRGVVLRLDPGKVLGIADIDLVQLRGGRVLEIRLRIRHGHLGRLFIGRAPQIGQDGQAVSCVHAFGNAQHVGEVGDARVALFPRLEGDAQVAGVREELAGEHRLHHGHGLGTRGLAKGGACGNAAKENKEKEKSVTGFHVAARLPDFLPQL